MAFENRMGSTEPEISSDAGSEAFASGSISCASDDGHNAEAIEAS